MTVLSTLARIPWYPNVVFCVLCCLLPAEGAIDEAMAEVLDEEYPGGGMMNGGGGAGFVV